MGVENPHISVTELWRYTSGTVNLPEEDFEHLLHCFECQSLVMQFIDVLAQLAQAHPNQAA